MCFSWFKKTPVPTPTPEPTPSPVPTPIPVYQQYQLSSAQLQDKVIALAKEHLFIWDSTYWALSLDDWKKVIADVRQNLPVYVNEKFDCEDFAFSLMTRVTEKYQINTMAVVEGTVPGEHGYNLFICYESNAFTFHLLEPQTGEIDPGGYLNGIKTIIFS